jgi:drug/metabolite transporter (DMT)-like permease
MDNSSLHLRLAFGLAIAVALDTCTQILWKLSAARIPDSVALWDVGGAMLDQPLFIVFGLLMILKLINWLRVLEIAELSYAKPVTSLSYVTVSIASYFLLHERLHGPQILGILIVIAGVWCVSYPDEAGDRGRTVTS